MKTKKKSINLSNGIAIASLLLSIVSLVWIGGFRMSTLIHEVKDLKGDLIQLENRMDKRFENLENRLDKLENRFDRFEGEFHKMDVRVTTIEQQKP